VDAVTSSAIDPASPSSGAICRRRGIVATGLLFRRRGRRVRAEPPRVGSVVLVHDVVLVLVLVVDEETRETQSGLATDLISGSVRPSLVGPSLSLSLPLSFSLSLSLSLSLFLSLSRSLPVSGVTVSSEWRGWRKGRGSDGRVCGIRLEEARPQLER